MHAPAPPRVLIHKKRFDVFSNPNTERVLEAIDPARIVIYGVALDVCNRYAIEAAVRPVPQALQKFAAARLRRPHSGHCCGSAATSAVPH